MEVFLRVPSGNVRTIIYSSAVTLLSTLTSAQPAWVSEVMQQSRSVQIDKHADVITLHHFERVTIRSDSRAKITVQIATRVLRSGGISKASLVETVSPGREIDDLDGWRITPEGKVIGLEDENVAEISTSGMSGMYHDTRLLTAAFPGVSVGDVTAFEYELDEEDKGFAAFHRFVFQDRQPVRFVRYEVTVPDGWELRHSGDRMEPIMEREHGNFRLWFGRDLPYEPEEALSPPGSYFVRRIAVHAVSPAGDGDDSGCGWHNVIRWCMSILEGPAEPAPLVTTQAEQLVNAAVTRRDTLNALASFVSHDIRYVAVEIDKGRWHPREATETLGNRYGDCKDKVALFRSMLSGLGISSVAVLANPTWQVDSSFPSPFQFNHCIVGMRTSSLVPVQQMTAGWTFFDPTDEDVRFGEIPSILRGTRVLVLDSNSTGCIRIPASDTADDRTTQRARIRVDSSGVVLRGTIVETGEAGARARERFRTERREDIVDSWAQRIGRKIKNVTVRSFRVRDDQDSVVTEFVMETSRPVPMNVIELNVFSAWEQPPLRSGARVSPFWFGKAASVEVIAEWDLPLPIPRESSRFADTARCAGGDMMCQVRAEKNHLIYHYRERHTGDMMPPGDAPAAVQFDTRRRAAGSLSLFVGRKK